MSTTWASDGNKSWRMRSSMYATSTASEQCKTCSSAAQKPQKICLDLSRLRLKTFSHGDKNDYDHALQDGVAHALVRTLRSSLVLGARKEIDSLVEQHFHCLCWMSQTSLDIFEDLCRDWQIV